MAFPILATPEKRELQRKSYARIPQVLDIPNLIQVQLDSFEWFKGEGLRELFQEVSPIQDTPGKRFELRFLEHYFEAPKHSEWECRQRENTYAAPLYARAQLVVRETGERKEQKVFLGDVPMMTDQGTFVINGAERVVVSQLVRSPGIYFTLEEDPATGRSLCYAKLIPYRGAWLEFETSPRDILWVKVDRKRKTPVTTLLRAVGLGSNEELVELFREVDTNPEHPYLRTTLARETQGPGRTTQGSHYRQEGLQRMWELLRRSAPYDREAAESLADALMEFYRRLRPGEPPSLENAQALLMNLFFTPRRYDLGRVGRYKMNRSLELDIPMEMRVLTSEDIVAVVRTMIQVNNGRRSSDDIDHLGNRRVRAVGELIQNQLRVGLLRMERVVRERMTIIDAEQATPSALVNIRPIVAAVREFFGGSQLSQFMDQTNPLAELTHKRRLSALGPGGLSRERAGFDVRDVHHSHYGRICPIETPEGPNIGLLGSMATYARINQFGFIETPYRKVIHELPNDSPDLMGRTLLQDVKDRRGRALLKAGGVVTSQTARRIRESPAQSIRVKASVSPEVRYLSADEEEHFSIAQANSLLDARNQFRDERVEIRHGERFDTVPPEQVDYMDVSPMQIFSVSTALIPFLEHDDANRALMGSNMQRQAVPLLRPEAPVVGTGMERRVARDSGQVALARVSGVVTSVTGDKIVVTDPEGTEHEHRLLKFVRTNQGTCMNQRPVVEKGQVVQAREPLADSSSTDRGELALGQNVLVAFMSWEGYNFEDAIIISERLLQQDKFTSMHIEKYECESRDTKLGPEEVTRDIPNVGEESLRNLDENGVILVGAQVGPGDILVGKITPKGETELSAEEKLLRAIFGEKARDVKDTSLRVPHGERGKVIDVKVLTQESHDQLPPGANQVVRVWVAQTRKIAVGDKMAGRHGNKGVISRVLPVEDMPYLPDGTPVDLILNPIGVPSRMNLGQVLETHLGWATKALDLKVVSPVFDGATDTSIEDSLARAWFLHRSGALRPEGRTGQSVVDQEPLEAWLQERGYDAEALFSDENPGLASEACMRIWFQEEDGPDTAQLSLQELRARALRLNQEGKPTPPVLGKTILYDGRTGQPFRQPVTVGQIYVMKLIHLVEDKIHARSTGPYSLITQQPLGGKAQFGGQRFGEMEVWALEAYSSAHNLQEMLTVKSDDVVGRVKTFEAIVKGEDIDQPGVPESFHVLMKELQSLGLSVQLLKEAEEQLVLPLENLEAPSAVEELEKESTLSLPSSGEDAEGAPNDSTAPEQTEERPE